MKLLNTKEAAKYLGISPYYLRNMRQGDYSHAAPPHKFIMIKNLITAVYDKKDLDLWKLAHNYRKLTEKLAWKQIVHIRREYSIGKTSYSKLAKKYKRPINTIASIIRKETRKIK